MGYRYSNGSNRLCRRQAELFFHLISNQRLPSSKDHPLKKKACDEVVDAGNEDEDDNEEDD